MSQRFDPDQTLPLRYRELLPTPEELLKSLPVLKTREPEWAVLDENGDPQVVATLLEWATWLECDGARQRRLEYEEIMRTGKKLVPELYVVSTVFLGLNHQYRPGAKPLWYETMVFAPPVMKYWEVTKKWATSSEDLWMNRAGTRTEALMMHQEALYWIRDYIRAKGKKPYAIRND